MSGIHGTNNAAPAQQANQAQEAGPVQAGNLGDHQVQAAPAQPRGNVLTRVFHAIANFLRPIANLFGGNGTQNVEAAPAQPRAAELLKPEKSFDHLTHGFVGEVPGEKQVVVRESRHLQEVFKY